jgi:PHD/YefM family antitoxin component YafN of YafNO toxin-antitoxin module
MTLIRAGKNTTCLPALRGYAAGNDQWVAPHLILDCKPTLNVVTFLHAHKEGAAMTITTLSSREFNQDASRAKKAAKDGPVFITDRGRLAHVLLTIEEYQRLSGSSASIINMLAMPEEADIEFEAPRAQGFTKPVDLS